MCEAEEEGGRMPPEGRFCYGLAGVVRKLERGAIGSSRFTGIVPVKGNPAEPGGHEKDYADKNVAHHGRQSESRRIRGTRQALPRQAKGKGLLPCPSTWPDLARQSPQAKAPRRQRRA